MAAKLGNVACRTVKMQKDRQTHNSITMLNVAQISFVIIT